MSVPFLTPAIIVGMMIGCFAVLQGETLEKSKPAHRLIIVWMTPTFAAGRGRWRGWIRPKRTSKWSDVKLRSTTARLSTICESHVISSE